MSKVLDKIKNYFTDSSHKHVVIRGNGVFGTTTKHIVSNENAKEAVKQVKALKAHSA